MPFKEIGKKQDWVRISKKYHRISICKSLRDKGWSPASGNKPTKARLYYDKEGNLFGIEPSHRLGYKLSSTGRIRSRKIPDTLDLDNKYLAHWDNDKNMVIVDLSKDL